MSGGLMGFGRQMRGAALLALVAALPFGLTPGVVRAEATAAAGAATPSAEAVAAVDALLAALRIGDTVEILREEGMDYGRTLEADMFSGSVGSGWEAQVALIYDGARMGAAFREAMIRQMADDPAALADIRAFFEGDLGAKVVGLEIEARRAYLDDAAEEASKVAWAEAQAEETPRVAALERFVAVNDLVDSNVSGALNANLAFYQGMAESGAFGGEMTEEQMLSDVWAQEPEVRQSTTEWVYSYLNLSYGPLSDAELAEYIAFSESEAGQKLNRALFAAYDEVFTPISRALGVAVGRQMQGQDI